MNQSRGVQTIPALRPLEQSPGKERAEERVKDYKKCMRFSQQAWKKDVSFLC
jgi:hypothetical protein